MQLERADVGARQRVLTMYNSLLCYSGDDTGLLKKVRLSPPAVGAVQRWGEQSKGGGVACACWGPGGSEDLVGAGYDSGAVRVWSTATPGWTEPVAAFASESGSGVLGVRCTGNAEGSARLVACDRAGVVRTWAWGGDGEAAAEAAVPLAEFEAGGAVGVATFDAEARRVAVGGRGRELSLWDVETGAVAYKARNVPNDNLDLQVPIWVSGARWLPGQPTVLAVSTGYVQSRLLGEVRLYDVAAGRRPTARRKGALGEEAVRSIACTPDGRYVLAGSGSGSMVRLDLRMSLKPVGRYKGAAGSIRQIEVHREQH